MGLLILLVATAILLGYCQTDEKVSFYGASYIHFPVQEAKGGTDISFRFRTHLPDAILLLAAGKTDYCLIKLEAGRLKVHINLGAGESEMASPGGLTLNDLTWHEVNITRREANITLRIDVIHTTRSILPGRFFELNIHYGVYIGGLGYFNELFLGHTEYLRGCMANIMYNGAKVVEYAKSRRSKSKATAITWGCSAEFDASRDVEVSFVEDGAFTSIPRPIPRNGSRWEFELKTGSDSGMLLYNTGHASYADYLGIELHNGNIRVLMNKGNGPTELTHTRNVTDGKWHRVSVDFNPSMITIKIDKHDGRMNLPLGGNRFLDLAETLYIGGTELNKRARAISQGLNSGDKSYRGCLRGMILDGKPLGLPDVKVSQGTVAGCVWSYPCLMDKPPCRHDSICEQIGVGSFACTCDQRESCVNNDYAADNAVNGSSNLPVKLDIISLTQLSVFEGEKISVTRDNIEMIMDIAKYDMDESGIIMNVVTTPKHGTINHETRTLESNSSFTLRDVNMEKIQYIHDGSESTEDRIILELRLTSGSDFKLPSYLGGGLRFPLLVNITPVNDPPVLEIPATKVLRLAQGTRRTLSKELVWTVDADTPSEMLTYTVLRADTDAGHVERLSEPGKSIVTFTQAELMRGTVAYVHRGNAKSNALLGLQVSDGMANSLSGFLRISAYPLQIKLIHNTGLVVVHRSFTHLRSSNLSFATNSDDPSIEILYDIVTLPVYGLLQKFNNSTGSWTSVDSFTSRDIDNENIRYLHNVDSPSIDEFKFQASVREVKTQQNFDFHISFIDLELRETRRIAVNFTNIIETLVTSKSLKYQTNPLVTYPSKIKYYIIRSTKYGNAMLLNAIIKNGDTFTQDDIDTGRFKYRLFKSAYSTIYDEITFQVTAPQCQSIISNLSLVHQAGRKGNSFEQPEILSVREGSSVALKIVNIDAKSYGADKIMYNVTFAPKNGWLTVVSRDNEVTRENSTYFTSDELDDKSVLYHHDDSETLSDSFRYVGVSIDETDFMYAGEFDISVELQNDNPPIRENLNDFHIVTNGERPLTNGYLSYVDIDTGTRPNDLIYHRRNISNADIYRIDDNSPSIEEFTQQDVNDRKIMLKHRGEERGIFEFTVTDGHWRIDDELCIIANSPYVNFLTGNASIVRFNGTTELTLREIDVETNVNANDREIRFNIVTRPKHGTIFRNSRETYNFSRDDLIRDLIVYRHHGDTLSKDDFKLRAQIRNVSSETRVIVRVYGKFYWEPLIVKNNRTILVEETTSVVIGRSSLEIQHSNITASEIVYFVRERPRYGYLEVQNSEDSRTEDTTRDDDDTSIVRHFDQSMINEKRVYYVQSMINRTYDYFIVDVTNGVTWTRGMMIKFVIIPDKIYVESAGNLTVLEGKSLTLRAKDFRVTTSYYAGKITDYRIIGKTKHGHVIDSTGNKEIKKFSQKHLNASVIIYKHNGDEFPYDDLRIIAIAGDKTSGPIDLRINVIPINDELPVIVNHTTINIWQGGSVVINSMQLASFDNDTSSNDLIYNLTRVQNGYLWHNDTPHAHIYNFTQAQIDDSKIIFTHTNGTTASFSFVLFDGVHSTSNHNITLTTMPVRLVVKVNNPLNVFPLTRKSISTMLLVTTCSDEKRDVRYIVRKGPNLGKIIMETSEGTWQEVDRFTQYDVNASRVTYEHTKQFMDLSTNDSFVFDVETHFAEIISNQVFRIDVSVSSGGLDRYITARTVRVEEGGSANVVMNITGIVKYLRTKAGIESPNVLSQLTGEPSHGHVMLLPDLNITTFDQQQIENEKIAYYHDHSDTLEDRISFSLYLTPGHVILCNATIPVVINPINDEPFKLITNEPFITVVQNQTGTIKRENLLTIDPDTAPDGLIYHLITAPTSGRLFLVPHEQNNNTATGQLEQWTQQDVDDNRLVYEHNGTTKAVSFYFRVSDQSFNPVYMLFNIQVLPIRLNITVTKSISLPQGSNMADISENNIRLDTNARQERVIYVVTKSPKHGMLYVRDVAAVNFRHSDLLSRSVIFVQTDMNVSNDSFTITASLSDYRTSEVRVEINVVPLMIIQTMNAIAGEKTRITLRHMDATPLAELTRSTPQYRVTRRPKYCRIKRIIRSYGDKRVTREREITRFAHTEIMSEVIYVVCRRLPITEIDGLTDGFEFRLAAAIYQPATGYFVIRVRNNSGDANNTLSGPMDPVGHEGEMAVAPNTSNDYILIIGMLLGVFLLGVVVIITIRCRHNRYKQNANENKQTDTGTTAIGVIPLPRPPDHLMPATSSRHNLKRFGDHTSGATSSTPLPVQSSTTTTSTLPQCKVIPLSALDSVTGSEADVSSRYPYGAADGDEWSSFETGELPCQTATTRRPNPLLRRNQYWV